MKLSNSTLSSILTRGNNNFDIIRLIASLAVIFAHSYALFQPDLNIGRLSHAGIWAVNVFFFISGIFITASFNNSESKIRFVLLRVSRIWPALIVCLLITTFVLGPIVTQLNIETYLTHPETINYFKTNSVFENTVTLPGVFEATHFPAVNGALWTLAPEVRCYMFVFVAGLLGMLSSRKSINLTCLFVMLVNAYYPHFIPYFRINQPLTQIGGCFLLGMFAYANRDVIRLDWKLAIGLFVLHMLFRKMQYGYLITYISGLYFVLYIASIKSLGRIKLGGDYSYGVYIYGFVVQETVNYSFPQLKATASLFITIPITLIIAIISWNLIEKPSLAVGRSLANLIFDLTQYSKKAWLRLSSKLSPVDHHLYSAPTPINASERVEEELSIETMAPM